MSGLFLLLLLLIFSRDNFHRLKGELEAALERGRRTEEELERGRREAEEEVRRVREDSKKEAGLLLERLQQLEREAKKEDREEDVVEVWRRRLGQQVEQVEVLQEVVAGLQQENGELRGQLRAGVAEVEQGMAELVLQYEAKVGRLERQVREKGEAPGKEQRELEEVLRENSALRSRLKSLVEAKEEVEGEARRVARQLGQVQEAGAQVEADLKAKLRQMEGRAAGLEQQVEVLQGRLDGEEARVEELGRRSRTSTREVEVSKSRLAQVEGDCALKVSQVQVERAREVAGLKQQLLAWEQRAGEAEARLEVGEKEWLEAGVRHRLELERAEGEVEEAKRQLCEAMQKAEERRGELGLQLRGLSERLEEVEEERQHYRQERDRMLRGFDEDMRKVEQEREDMGRELVFLRQEVERRRSGAGEASMKITRKEKVDKEASDDLTIKCKKYSKLIHKLRERLALTKVSSPDLSSSCPGRGRAGHAGEESHGGVCQS